MRRGIDRWTRFGTAAVLLPALSLAQVAPAAAPAAWRDGAIEVPLSNNSTWSQPIAFRLLATSPGMGARFQASDITVQERMRPDGPLHRANASFHGRIWLQWGVGKVPLFFEGMPYRLIAAPAAEKGSGYRWVNTNAARTIAATADRVQTIHASKATWCTWFTVRSTESSDPHIADGPTPTIDWMLWRRPTGAVCK